MNVCRLLLILLAGLLSAVAAKAADPADEMSLMLTHDSFVGAHTPSQSGIAGSDHDSSLIDQQGSGNYARTEQFYTQQGSIDLQQQGAANVAGLFQADGVGNVAQALQQGNSNYLSGTQSGSYNNAQLNQLADGNRLALDQQNGYNSANVTQNGYSNLRLDQSGFNQANITVDAGTAASPIQFTLIQPPGDAVTIHITN
jgi:hypothetical protein